jgi:hypothetical protein
MTGRPWYKRRAMVTLLAPVLAVAGFVLYVVVTTRFAIWREVPWEFLAVSAAGVALGAWRLVRRPSLATGVAAVAAVGAAGFFAANVFVLSSLGPREERPRVGERFPEFTLPTSTGGTYGLADARGKKLLVLCYRGDW